MRKSKKLTPQLFRLGHVELYEGEGLASARLFREHECYHLRGFSPPGEHFSHSSRNLKLIRMLAERLVSGELCPGRQIDRICKIQDGERYLEMSYGQIAYALKLYGEHVQTLKKFNAATDQQITTQQQIGDFIA
jgi:hypothetical protein